MKIRRVLLTCFVLASACSSKGGGGTGGTANTGGSTNTGGMANTGGMTNTGGMSGSGGALPDPCAGKMCGELCTVECDPADPNCVPPDIDKYCDKDSNCIVGIPTCGP